MSNTPTSEDFQMAELSTIEIVIMALQATVATQAAAQELAELITRREKARKIVDAWERKLAHEARYEP